MARVKDLKGLLVEEEEKNEPTPEWRKHLEKMWSIMEKRGGKKTIEEIVENCRNARKEIYDEEYRGRYTHLSR